MKAWIRKSLLLGVMILLVNPVQAQEEGEKISLATELAVQQLQEIDSGDYILDMQYAPMFKDLVTQEQWSAQISAVRPPLGSVISRQELFSQFFTYLPGDPDGKYVVIQFQTQFEHTAEAIETVTMVYDATGSVWRFGGYFIK